MAAPWRPGEDDSFDPRRGASVEQAPGDRIELRSRCAYVVYVQDTPNGHKWIALRDPAQGHQSKRDARVRLEAGVPSCSLLPRTSLVGARALRVAHAGRTKRKLPAVAGVASSLRPILRRPNCSPASGEPATEAGG